EAGDRSAGDRDEDEGEYLAAEKRPMAVDEGGERRHPDLRMQQDDRDGKERHRAELEEGGEIIAWREQQPDRQDGGDPTIPDHEAGERQTRPVEESAQQRMSIDPSSGQHR